MVERRTLTDHEGGVAPRVLLFGGPSHSGVQASRPQGSQATRQRAQSAPERGLAAPEAEYRRAPQRESAHGKGGDSGGKRAPEGAGSAGGKGDRSELSPDRMEGTQGRSDVPKWMTDGGFSMGE